MTSIEWTHAPGFTGETWNPIVGCSVISPGCANCYAMKFAGRRLENNGATPHYSGLTEPTNSGPVWTGKIAKAPDRIFLKPFRWSPKKPRCVFVNSMGDLFHENVPDFLIDQVFAIMALAPHHRFLVLTKRGSRMREYLSEYDRAGVIYDLACGLAVEHALTSVVLIAPGMDEAAATAGPRCHLGAFPLPNVWLGVSAEDQRRADERIPDLLATPAAKRFVSAEPLLGPIDFFRITAPESWGPNPDRWKFNALDTGDTYFVDGGKNADDRTLWMSGDGPYRQHKLDWIIAGGESGPGARPAHPDWFRSIRDQCKYAGVPFFFKQWGEWGPDDGPLDDGRDPIMDGRSRAAWWDKGGARWRFEPSGYHVDLEKSRGNGEWLYKLGKKTAGATLDGTEHREWP